jgi:Leucine-rich repeat (LRR) protein
VRLPHRQPADRPAPSSGHLDKAAVDLACQQRDRLASRGGEPAPAPSRPRNPRSDAFVQVGEWKDVSYVNLRCNKIKELPSSVRAWTKIKFLYLGTNQLTAVPNQVR